MKFREIKAKFDEYNDILKNFEWEITNWIKSNRLNYIFIDVTVDKRRVKLELIQELTPNELNGLLNNFGLRLSMKQVIQTENISEDQRLYPLGSSRRTIYILR